VLYLHGSTLHPYPLAYQLCTVEDLIHKRNQLLDAFFLEDQGSFLSHILPIVCYHQYQFHIKFIFALVLVTFVTHLHWICEEVHTDYCRVVCNLCVYVTECREHGVVGDMRDAWPSARRRKNVDLIRTYHGFKGTFPCAFLYYLFYGITSHLPSNIWCYY